MENGGAAGDHSMESETPERYEPEPYDGAPAFPWMGQYQATPVEAFPTLNGPIVHEGFVPDDDDGMDLEDQTDYTGDWSAPASSTTVYRRGFAGDLRDRFTSRHSARSPNEDPRFVGLGDRDGDSMDSSSDYDNDSSVSEDNTQ